MARLLALTLLAGALLVPATAGAATSSMSRVHASRPATAATRTYGTREAVTSRNPVTTAAAIAELYWGAVPCAGQITITADSPLAPGLDSSTDGWVTFNSSLGADNLDAPPATYTDCTISLAHWQWASWTDMESDWGMFCLTMTHEMGHLLGHKHSLTPGSVMAPVFTNDHNVPKLCNSTWLPGWRPTAAQARQSKS
jgi:hypothetical protein